MSGSAEAGLQQFTAAPFDLVITGQESPRMSGLELLAEVGKVRPGVRMMLISGYPSVGAAVEALDAGFLGFLVKLLGHVDEALQEVRRVLARYRAGGDGQQQREPDDAGRIDGQVRHHVQFGDGPTDLGVLDGGQRRVHGFGGDGHDFLAGGLLGDADVRGRGGGAPVLPGYVPWHPDDAWHQLP